MAAEKKCILFATDLSEKARKIFNYAASLAARDCARMIILHVLQEPPKQESITMIITNLIGEERWQSIREQERQRAQDILIGKVSEIKEIRATLGTLCDYIQERHPDMQLLEDDIVAIEGPVEKTIVDVANRNHCEYIVMGYQQHRSLVDSLPGSIVKRVLRSTNIPVLLVPS
jgi:nucleotide-binding universal stress UspA family protein